MDIFIGNLPLSASVTDLRHLFGNAGTNARFRIVQKKYANGAQCCYGRAVIVPDELARSLIDELHRRRVDDKNLVVRPYIERNMVNERRAPMWRGQPWTRLNRRKAERRNGGY